MNPRPLALRGSPDPSCDASRRQPEHLSGCARRAGRSTSLWDVLASGRVVATTFNDPGEPIFSQPANSVTLPSLHFTEATSIQGIK